MAIAFQRNAFQQDAFQTAVFDIPLPPATINSSSYLRPRPVRLRKAPTSISTLNSVRIRQAPSKITTANPVRLRGSPPRINV